MGKELQSLAIKGKKLAYHISSNKCRALKKRCPVISAAPLTLKSE